MEWTDHVFGSFQGDMFALGCVFFFLLSAGRHPFGSENYIEFNIVRDQAIVLQELMGSANDDWKMQLVERMILKDPDKRVQVFDVIATCRSSASTKHKRKAYWQ